MRRLLGVVFEVVDTAWYLLAEFVIDPIRRRNFDFDAYKAAVQAEKYRAAEGL
jgi:hypothetical protein